MPITIEVPWTVSGLRVGGWKWWAINLHPTHHIFKIGARRPPDRSPVCLSVLPSLPLSGSNYNPIPPARCLPLPRYLRKPCFCLDIWFDIGRRSSAVATCWVISRSDLICLWELKKASGERMYTNRTSLEILRVYCIYQAVVNKINKTHMK